MPNGLERFETVVKSINGSMRVITVRVTRFVGVSVALSSVLHFGCFGRSSVWPMLAATTCVRFARCLIRPVPARADVFFRCAPVTKKSHLRSRLQAFP